MSSSIQQVTDEIRIARGDDHVIIARHFEDGSGPQTFSLDDEEIGAVADHLNEVSDDYE